MFKISLKFKLSYLTFLGVHFFSEEKYTAYAHYFLNRFLAKLSPETPASAEHATLPTLLLFRHRHHQPRVRLSTLYFPFNSLLGPQPHVSHPKFPCPLLSNPQSRCSAQAGRGAGEDRRWPHRGAETPSQGRTASGL